MVPHKSTQIAGSKFSQCIDAVDPQAPGETYLSLAYGCFGTVMIFHTAITTSMLSKVG